MISVLKSPAADHRILALSFLLASGVGLWPAQAIADDKSLEQVKTALQQAQRKLKKFNQQQSSASRALRKTETAIGKLSPKIKATQKALRQQQKKSQTLKTEVRQLSLKQQQQEQLIAEHLAAAYQLGREKKLKLLLNQEHADKVSRIMQYYDYLNQARQEEIKQYQATRTALANSEAALQQNKAKIQQQQQILLKQKKSLQAQLKKRQQSLQKLNRKIASEHDSIQRLKREQTQLEALLVGVEEALTQIKIPKALESFSSQKGKLPWPSAAGWRYQFGRSRGANKPRWQGFTLAAREGSPVRAIFNGRVVFADWFNGKGLLLILDHGDGYMSLYAHNQSLLVEPGEWVNTGEQIANVGRSGGSSKPGLYFEIRKSGKPVNPKLWCQKRG